MKRKVNRVGSNTLTVSLPSKWVKENNIQVGDEIDVIEDKGTLVINPNSSNPHSKEANINLCDSDWRFIRSAIGSLYRKGYTYIDINYNSEATFKLIEKAINSLIGYEIFEKTPKRCVIKSMVLHEGDEWGNVVNKIVNSIKTLQSLLRENYVNKNHDAFDEMNNYRINAWKFRDYAMRLSNKHPDRENAEYKSIIVWTLEKINKNYIKLYQVLTEYKPKIDKAFLKLFDKTIEYFEYFSKHIHKMDFESAEYIHKKNGEVLKLLFEFISKKTDSSVLIPHMVENAKRIQDLSSSLIALKY